jgi:hypothetical protein
MVIEIGKEYDRAPSSTCPHCKKDLHLMLDAWKPDIVKIIKSNCPHCGGEIFASLLILTAKTQRGIVHGVQSVIEYFQKMGNVNLIDNPTGKRIIT